MDCLSAVRASTKGQLMRVELPRIEHADEFDRYTPTADEPSRYHEAGCGFALPAHFSSKQHII